MTAPDLPNLADGGEIIPDNIRAVAATYFAWQLEQLRLFDVVDRLVELAQSGMLPLGPSSRVARPIDWSTRFTLDERQSIYTRVFGVPGGDTGDMQPNTDFPGLWLRFISAVAAFESPDSGADCSDTVGTAARDLAQNASLYGSGAMFGAASRLHDQIALSLELLSAADIHAAYGATDAWSLVERVSQAEFGGSTDIRRYIQLAESGASILRWLAEHSADLADPSAPSLPDAALIASCDQWLAASAAPDFATTDS